MIRLALALFYVAQPATGQVTGLAPARDTLPTICLEGQGEVAASHSPMEFSEQRDSIFLEVERRVNSFHGFFEGPFGHSLPSMEDLWQRDSVAVRFELARIVGDAFMQSDHSAEVAAMLYRRLSGHPGAMLTSRTMVDSPERTRLALVAIRSPLTAAEEKYVLGIACRTGWILLALKNPPGAIELGPNYWYRPLSRILYESYRLLGSRYRAGLRPLMSSTLRPSPDFQWLEQRYRLLE